MISSDIKKLKLPDIPGVYRFIGKDRKVLYIGKATSLRDRVRSYFSNDLLHTRGKHIVDMVTLAKTVRFTPTASVLDAIILEASLIKKHQPPYNTKEKDDKSWNYVVITDEEYPRVLVIRGRNIFGQLPTTNDKLKTIFGPFPQGTNLKEALKIVRKIFPFRDTCLPAQTRDVTASDDVALRDKNKHSILDGAQQVSAGKPLSEKLYPVVGVSPYYGACFNRQIGLCPGVCTGEISKKKYAERIREIALFFGGKKSALLRHLERLMHAHAKLLEFEEAGECKRTILALKHIKDVSLINEEVRSHSQKTSSIRRKAFRIEAYDVAHISGKYTVGAMTVVLDGEPTPSAYRKFKIRIDPNHSDDTLHLEEVLTRRFGHKEWSIPDLLVVDGGAAQRRRAERTLKELGVAVPIVSVVKDNRHKLRAILGNKELALSYKRAVLIANGEAHRFAIAYHRQLRGKFPR